MKTQLSIPASPATWIATEFQLNITSNLIKTNKHILQANTYISGYFSIPYNILQQNWEYVFQIFSK